MGRALVAFSFSSEWRNCSRTSKRSLVELTADLPLFSFLFSPDPFSSADDQQHERAEEYSLKRSLQKERTNLLL